MTRVHLLVEGQTEEAFVNELLIPYCATVGIYMSCTIVTTRTGYKGGVASYAKVKPQILRLCKDKSAYISTMFDLYALPNDFPGKTTSEYSRKTRGIEKAIFLESALSRDIKQTNFMPNLLVHEFEALLFTQIDAFEQWTDDDQILEPLRVISSTTPPEDINDNRETSPSHRITRVMPAYQKTIHGPLIAADIGLDAIRQACPHFDNWLLRITQLK